MNRLLLALTTAVLTLLFLAPAAGAKDAVDFFGGFGGLGGQFNSQGPQSLTVNETGAGPANAGDVYALDNNRIERFGRDDNATPADPGDDTYFFISAWGADVVSGGGSGDVGDAEAKAYEVCTDAAQCQSAVASSGNGSASGNGGLDNPGSIAVDQDTGRLYVSERHSRRISVYEGDGAFLFAIGRDVAEPDGGSALEICDGATDVCRRADAGSGPGEIGEATNGEDFGLAISPPDGNPTTGALFLADPGNQRVNTYDLDGTSPGSIGSAAVFSGGNPTGLAIDSRGILYASNAKIERYDTQGVNGPVGFLAPIPFGTGERQEITVAASAGTFRLHFDPDGAGPEPARSTNDIPYNASGDGVNAPFTAAVSELLGHGIANFVCCVLGGPGDASGSNPYRITFQGAYGARDLPQLTCSDGSKPLSGGAGCSVSTAIPGKSGLIKSGLGTSVGALAVDPDSDGAGPDTDVLYAGASGAIQQFGPTNAPGLVAPPTDDDARHGTGPAFFVAQALAADPATGRLYAASSGAEGPGVYVLDETSPSAPEGSLDSIDEASAHGFTAHATIDPNGAPNTSYRFEYVTDAAYQASANERQQITLNKATGGSFTLSLSGQTTAPLAFDASAASVEAALEALPSIEAGNVSVSGAFGGPYTVEFTGGLAENDQTQLSATSSLTPAEASISVQTLTNGRAKDRFQHAQSTPTITLGHQEDPQAVTERIEPPGPGLLPNTTYHVRLLFQRRFLAEQQGGELTGATLATPPDLETAGSSLRSTTTATLLGRVLPNGSATTYRFQYGSQGPCDANPCTESDPVEAGSGQQVELASQQVTGLDPNTTYHYRIAASNGVGGTAFGSDRTLTTRATEAPLSHGEFPGPPDSDRAYEMVSIPDSSGNPVSLAGFAKAFAADGNRALYTVYGGFPNSDFGSLYAPYMAERPPGTHPTSGWQTHLITPPRAQVRSANWVPGIPGADDLSSLVALNGNPYSDEPIFWRLNAEGPAEKLLDVRLPTETVGVSPQGEVSAVPYEASADASRVIATLQFGTIDPAFPAAAERPNLYDISDGGAPQLVSLLPSGQPPACGASTPDMGWVSTDGSRVYFNSCSAGPLYERNLLTAQSKLISGPVISGPACSASMLRATSEDIFFTTQSRLDPEDVDPPSCGGGGFGEPTGNDVYRYDLGDQSLECLTCVIDGLPANVIGDSLDDLAIDPVGTRLYFSTNTPLLPGVPSPAIYRLNIASGDLAYVAPGGGTNIGPAGSKADLSSDGRFLSFYSQSSALDPLGGGFQNAGKGQHYLYDDEARSLICVSCPPDGAAPLAAARPETTNGLASSPGNDALADDGTLIFATDTPLTGADQNTPSAGSAFPGRDVYEFRDGRPLLISDGLTSWPDSSFAGPTPLAVSPSGRDAFFAAPARYTPDAIDSFTRLYDARIGGGIDFPPASLPPCDLNSGGCEGPASGAPDTPGAGSAAFEGPGNQPAAKEKPCPKGKRKTRHKGKARCVKPHHKRAKHERRAHR